jgi:hypothetical protein
MEGGGGEKCNSYRDWCGNVNEIDRFEDVGVDDRMIKQFVQKWVEMTRAGFIWHRVGTIGGLL